MNLNNGVKKGFTLVELFIVIGILVTIVAIMILILNPIEYLKRARDAQRLRDYALINQAVNFYSYNTSVGADFQDWDGPNYSESCKNQALPKIFVSVPDDNGEANPTPPSGWIYSRVNSDPLRLTDGSGWLPINFTDVSGGIRTLSVLPVDPINTFDSGFYYTYTCGSYELNLRFESDKYKALSEGDGGNESGVYEIGNDLSTAPAQAPYNPVAAVSSPVAPTLTFTTSQTSLVSGNSATLTWTATNADSCLASGGWSGSKAISGSETVSPTIDTAYILTCTGAGGEGQKSVSITVLPASGTVVLYPSAAGFYTQWTGGPVDVDDPKETPNDSDFIYSSVNAINKASTFLLTNISRTETITDVKLTIRARKTLAIYSWVIKPRLRSSTSGIDSDGTVQSLTTTWTPYTYTYTINPFTSLPWTWADINDLQAGTVISTASTNGSAQVSQIYLEVDYQN